ncbi:MAG: pyridoxine 5'-phosphate synthase, partial [Candidatus Electryoneaceae bacterium]|nr:pyridoxine 5'-phosphate synthase [Candidatus Electryoneaceae bacterium]
MRIGFYINSVIRLRDDTHREPEPALIAGLAEASGAQVILVGWTSSEVFLTEGDLYLIREVVQGDLIIVAPLVEQCVETIIKLHPDRVILVGAGWDGIRKANTVQPGINSEEISSISAAYRAGGVSVSLFLDPVVSA